MIFKFMKKKAKQLVEQPKPIGLAVFTTYTSCMGHGTSFYHPKTEVINAPGFGSRDFHAFHKIDDFIEDNVKVNETWFKKDEIFLFEDKTSDDLILYKREMKSRYKIKEYTDIHELYNNGLFVSCGLFGLQNNFYDKKLENKINNKMKNIALDIYVKP